MRQYAESFVPEHKQIRQPLSKNELYETSSSPSYKYYRKSQQTKNGTFDLRFDEIKNSLVDANPLKTAWTILEWKLKENDQGWPKDLKNLQHELPMQKPAFQVYQDKIVYTWIGHSTAVISIGKEYNILIDPVFADRVSPSTVVGPKRFRPPACTIDQLPKIDLVLVSHDHYDHLDEDALKKLFKRFPECYFIAGLNSKDVFPKGCRFIELDWTQRYELEFKDTKARASITFVPVCHWGRRGAFDKNKRLWGGFVIETMKKKRLFYSGDTGKCGVFEQIGKEFKNFDLCILPIGAYEPRKYLKNQHVNPQQAVQIHKQLGSKKSVGVHWGTFPLGTEHYTAARRDLQKSTKQQGLKEDQFITVNHGGSFVIDY